MAEMNSLKAVLIVMLFYAFAVTILAYTMPGNSTRYIQAFETQNTPSITETAETIQNSIQSQLNIPIIEIGALVFYSGNIVIDLFLNFAFAIPEMLSILLNGVIYLVNIPGDLVGTVQLFGFALFTIFYVLGIIQLLLGVRSGRSIA